MLSVGQLIGGVDRLTAIAGASFVLILVGFAVQRVLMDIIAGLAMFIERWYSVGDTIQIPMHELQGVVEDLSLRHTRLRTLDGEVIHIHNSQIPRLGCSGGAKDLRLEVFVTDQEKGIEMVDSVASILPEGPTTFVRKPRIEQVDELSETLFRISVRASVAPGREWLVDGFFADLIRERAEDGVIAHGPVTLSVDESAARSYARLRAHTPQLASSRPLSGELPELGEQAVDLLGRVVVDDPDADCAVLEPEALHHLGRVVVPVPDEDAALAEVGGDLRR